MRNFPSKLNVEYRLSPLTKTIEGLYMHLVNTFMKGTHFICNFLRKAQDIYYWISLGIVHLNYSSCNSPLSNTDAFKKYPISSTWMPKPNGRYLQTIFRCSFGSGKYCILIQISLLVANEDPCDIKSALVQIMEWRLKWDKSLHDPNDGWYI